MGGSIFVSISTLWTRKGYFKSHFIKVAKEHRGRRGSKVVRDVVADRELDAQRKIDEPIDKSEFESRHSGMSLLCNYLQVKTTKTVAFYTKDLSDY